MFLCDLRIFSVRFVLKNDVAPVAALPAEAATGNGTVFKFTLAAAERVKFDDP